MKCEVCLELLEEYLDGELAAGEQEQISAHLKTCTECFASFSTLSVEAEMFSRYDREIEVPPFFWTRIAQRTVAAKKQSVRFGWRRHASAMAMMLFVIALGVVYLRKGDPVATAPGTDPVQANATATTTDSNPDRVGSVLQRDSVGLVPKRDGGSVSTSRRKVKLATRATVDQSDVLSSDLGNLDIEDRDTAKHIEQTQNLLRSIRNFKVSDGDEDIDVSYDKALSRRLLNENVVLRRDAEMKAKFPTKSLLADVEPFLIDIANLPDQARPEDVRVIKERMQKTEIVAALMGYQERSPNNR